MSTTDFMERTQMTVTRKMEVKAELRRGPWPCGPETAGTATAGTATAAVPIGRTGPVATLKPERVQEWLTARPDWRPCLGNRVLQRTRVFPNGEAAAHFSAFVVSLAAALALPVKARVADRRVELSLFAPRHGNRFTPLTEAVLDFGARLG
jgi:hypothetical protein